MRKTEMPRLSGSNRARLWFQPLGASIVLLAACSPAPGPSPPSETAGQRLIQQNDAALSQWLVERERLTGRTITLQPIRPRPGDGSALFRRLWAQRIFDRSAELGGPERAWELIGWMPMIANGTTSTGLQAIGAVLEVGDNERFVGLECTGTLVGQRHFLTAAHCATKSREKLRVYLQHEGVLRVAGCKKFCNDPASSQCPGTHSSCSQLTDDLAVLELENPVLTVQPTPVDAAISALSDDPSYQIAGFGVFVTSDAGTWQLDYGGIKHRANGIKGADCPVSQDPARTICYQSFPVQDGEPTACNRDSGGPVLPASVDGKSLLGVTRQGASGCQDGYVKNVRLAHASYQQWLTDTIQLPDSVVPSHSVMEELSVERGEFLLTSTTSSLHSILVDEDADLLLITLNHEVYVMNPTTNQFDLKVRDPQGIYQCSDPSGAFTECRVESPEAGAWQIEIHPVRGAGLFQLTAQVLKDNQPTVPSPPGPPVVD